MYADITIFDPTTILDLATFEEPSQVSTGISYVFVNGTAVIDAGSVTPALPGRALRGPGYRR
jgi:dihydroorotase/N-acyl-D-amino-acid deacylase